MSRSLRNILIAVLAAVSFSNAFAQTSVQCVIDSTAPQPITPTTGTLHAIIIYCVDVGQNSLLPPNFLTVDSLFQDYFDRATFNNYHVQIAGILGQDSTHAFVSRVPHNFQYFICPPEFATDILQQADALYDFSQYDFDGDGYVDFLLFTFLNYAGIRGTVGLPNGDIFTTNDPDPRHPGQFIKIDGVSSNRGTSQRKDLRDLQNGVFDFIFGWFHELRHALFNFPDMDHFGGTTYKHYSVGGFDAMAGGAFGARQSPYNPWFSEQRGWGSFTPLTGNIPGAVMTDFYAGGTAYRFGLSLPGNAAPNQKFLVTYHQKIQANQWTFNWPVDVNNGGIMIWHVAKQDVGLYDAYRYYEDRRLMPIDIEAANGKFNWTDYPDSVHNTGVANALTGLDSLEIRKISAVADTEIQGPYYHKAHGSASVPYLPNSGKVFTFYSNPNSNFYNSSGGESYAHNVTSGFSVKNIVRSGGTTSIDLYTNDYTITSNTTLTAGTWYVNSNLTVASGVTLTTPSGTTLNFSPGTSLTVSGTLVANGTSAQHIAFTRSGANNWQGITLNGANGSSLQYCDITYASSPIVARNMSSLTINCCTVGNSNFYDGVDSTAAAMKFYNSSPTISGVVITGTADVFPSLNASWNGIRFASGSTGSITNSVIQNCGRGNGIVVQGGSAPTISSDSIRNNHFHGIIVVSNGSAWPLITGNQVLSNGIAGGSKVYNGINFYESTGTVQQNNVQNSNYGIYSDHISWPNAGSAVGSQGDNLVTLNNYGIVAHDNSTLGFGGGIPSKNEYWATCNSIYGNDTYDAASTVSSQIAAQYNWWGQSPPNTSKIFADGSSGVDYSNYLSGQGNCPGGGAIPLPSISMKMEGTSPGADMLALALEARAEGDFTTAVSFLRKVLQNSSETALRHSRALVELYNTFRQHRDETILNDVQQSTVSASLGKLAAEILVGLYLANNQLSDAKTAAMHLKQEYAGTETEKDALITLASLSAFDGREQATSQEALGELVQKYGTSVDAGLLAALGGGSSAQPSPNTALAGASSSEELSLSNYPNPFNPTTVIRYHVSEIGHVTLKVFDILGREVATLVDELQQPGAHSVRFDASKLASGVYFARLETGDKSVMNKISLVR